MNCTSGVLKPYLAAFCDSSGLLIVSKHDEKSKNIHTANFLFSIAGKTRLIRDKTAVSVLFPLRYPN